MSFVDAFKKVNREEWLAKANLDLKGKIIAEDLLYKVEKGMSFSPFLTNKDVVLQDSLLGPKTMSGVRILASSPKEAKSKALEMLNLGTDVLAFDVESGFEPDILLDGIFLDMVTVFLYCSEPDVVRQALDLYLNRHYSVKITEVVLINKSKGVSLLYDESFASRMQKISDLLKDYKETLYLSVELKRDFLAQIAELRAIRKLASTKKVIVMAQICTAAFDGSDIHPLIISNYLLMSAYMGMADMAFGIPYADDGEITRLCLNIHNILKEESGFNFVTDPTAGAYIIEKLTAEMISTAGE